MHSGGMSQLRPISKLEVHLFRNGKGVIDLNAEIPDGAFNLGVARVPRKEPLWPAAVIVFGLSVTAKFNVGAGNRDGLRAFLIWLSVVEPRSPAPLRP